MRSPAKRRRSIDSTSPESWLGQRVTSACGRCSSRSRSIPGVWAMSPIFTVCQEERSRIRTRFPAEPDEEQPAASAAEAARNVRRERVIDPYYKRSERTSARGLHIRSEDDESRRNPPGSDKNEGRVPHSGRRRLGGPRPPGGRDPGGGGLGRGRNDRSLGGDRVRVPAFPVADRPGPRPGRLRRRGLLLPGGRRSGASVAPRDLLLRRRSLPEAFPRFGCLPREALRSRGTPGCRPETPRLAFSDRGDAGGADAIHPPPPPTPAGRNDLAGRFRHNSRLRDPFSRVAQFFTGGRVMKHGWILSALAAALLAVPAAAQDE